MKIEEHLCKSITRNCLEDPDKTAIIYPGGTLSYRDLEDMSNQTAREIFDRYNRYNQLDIDHKTGSVQRIPILLDRSPLLITAILGVLKAGMIFVPLSPQLPVNRLKTMLQEIDACWIITDSSLYPTYQSLIETFVGLQPLFIDQVLNSPGQENIPGFEPVYNKNCYIYFTSGSTGIPRGVLGRHRSLAHFIQWEIDEFQVDASFHFSQLTFPSFDPYLRDIFVPLVAGGTCCIPENDILLDPYQLIKWCDYYEITLMHTVPSLFKALLPAIETDHCLHRLRYILLAGEMLRGKDIARFIQVFKERIGLVNIYGPTETTLAKFFYRVQPADIERTVIPVGKPIRGAQALVLDDSMQPCLPGNLGEIYIRTPYISSGYFNAPDLQHQVFIKNPFTDNPNDIIYKTGDLGRLHPGDILELAGRSDHQVKIGGGRVEIQEIEHHLLGHPQISDAVVICQQDNENDNDLTAYFVPIKNGPFFNNNPLTIHQQLKEFLAKHLPDYMIPDYFVPMDSFPLNTSGKIDRKALPAPDKTIGTTSNYEPPKNENEEKLVQVWRKILKRERIGTNDDFFELGGKSLDIMLVASEINKEFKIEIPMVELFKTPKIKNIAQLLTEKIYIEDPYVLLNSPSSRKLFCFPPSIGYSIAYKGISIYLSDYSFYAFNFIEEDDRVERYINIISGLQPTGQHVLFGWSAAGSLVLDVAYHLEQKGFPVSDIILMDSSWNELVRKQDKVNTIMIEQSNADFQNWIADIKNNLVQMGMEYLETPVTRKIHKYMEYYTRLTDLKMVNANIHFIVSTDRENIQITAGWEKFTTKNFFVYQGYGPHQLMLENQFGEQNAGIIKKILENIFGPV